MVLTLCFPHCVHKLYETHRLQQEVLPEDSCQMETMSYPCSPLIPFPTQHEQSSYFLWSPQAMIPLENGNMGYGDADPSPDQQQDHEVMNMLLQEANVLLLQDELSNGDQRLGGQENGSLLAVQEEFMEESSLGDLLVAGARAVESGDSIGASAILSRIDDLIPGVPRRSCQRAAAVSSSDHLACYFARGLQSRISGECRPVAALAVAAPGNRMPAYRMLQELSPFIKFAHFTANQAILEATTDDPVVHVVDLNVGEGVQWASLMSDLARHGSKPFHLTEAAVTADAGAHAHRMAATRRWLSEFAGSLNLPFQYSSLHLRSDEDLHGFAAATSCNGGSSSVIVACDTTDEPYSSLTKLQQLLAGSVVKILRPKLVIVTEEELFRMGRNRNPPRPGPGGGTTACLFVEFFREALDHFSAVLDSLASCFGDGGYGAWLGLVETETLGPRIQDAVGQYGTAVTVTGGACSMELEGFRACEMSSFSVAQAKMLAALFSRGFGVVHDQGRLTLCWKSRLLTSVSIWSSA